MDRKNYVMYKKNKSKLHKQSAIKSLTNCKNKLLTKRNVIME